MDTFIELEKIFNLNTELIEMTKIYCEHHIEKTEEISVIYDILTIIFNNQKECNNILSMLYTLKSKNSKRNIITLQ